MANVISMSFSYCFFMNNWFGGNDQNGTSLAM